MKTVKWLLVLVLVLLLLLLTLLFIGSLLSVPVAMLPKQQNTTLLIRNITLVDVVAGSTLQAQDVLIADGVIRQIVPSGQVQFAGDMTVLAGEGRYLLPGLWDMHIHTIAHSPQLHFPLYLANGVLNVRDLGNSCSWYSGIHCQSAARQWRQAIENKQLLGPGLWHSVSQHLEEITADQVPAVLNQLKAQGETLIKLQLGHDVNNSLFQQILTQAAALQMPVVAHLPGNLQLAQLDLANLNSIEHDSALYPYCSNNKEVFAERIATMQAVVTDFNEEKCRQLLRLLVAAQVAYTPTHVASSQQAQKFSNTDYLNDVHNRYIDPLTLGLWRFYALLNNAGLDDADRQALTQLSASSLLISKLAADEAVLVLAGTDAPDAFIYPGFSLHQELQMLKQAGLSNAQVLRTATIDAAHVAGAAQQSGSIAVGKRADMLILTADPLLELNALQQLDAVVYQGELYQQQDLEQMKSYVQNNAGDNMLLWQRLGQLIF